MAKVVPAVLALVPRISSSPATRQGLALYGNLSYNAIMTQARNRAAREHSPTPRSERLEARITPELKARFCHAAALEGKTLTEFMLDHLDRAARQTLETWQSWELTRRDQEALVALLLAPPEPNAALRAAARRYRRRTADA